MVATRQMPPWLAAPGCADYHDDRSLSQAQIDTLTAWIDTGLAKGDPSDYHAPAVHQVGLTRVDRTLAMPIVYTPQVSPDEYRCFVIDWPETTTRYVTGFAAKPGNPSIVHHVIAFVAKAQDAAAFQQLDDADPGPGYACFGDAGGGRLASMIGAWAPGSQGSDFPASTGLKMEPGMKIILQVHYNTLNAPPAPDQTSVEVKIDDQVDKLAAILFFTDPEWVFNHRMTIPAGQPDVRYTYATDPTPFLNLINPDLVAGKPLTIYGAALHQHLRGTRSNLSINHWSGRRECLLDIERWNFHWQMQYGFAQPKTLKSGDELAIECHWDNSAANQPVVGGQPLAPQDLNWGEGSTDEMCLGTIYVTQ
jgi:hypothetical protein